MLRRRSIVCLSLALAAPLFASTSASAQEGGPRASATGATSASPPPPTPPENPPADRSTLVPSTAPAAATAPPAPSTATSVSSPVLVNPARDQQELAAQGSQRPTAGELAAGGREVFSDDWWGRARPIIELHGYFRTRAELFHNFSLGRHSSTIQGNDPNYLYPIPIDQSYTQPNGTVGQAVTVCGTASSTNKTAFGACNNKMQTGANLRLRLDPEVHISDNLRILTQVDLLDNLVLGSTPDAYAMQPATATPASGAQPTQTNGTKANYPTGYQPAGANGYAPIGFLSTTQGSPTAGVNGWTNSINVKRVWGEYMTPVGQLRFGRMPGHWGLGMVENSGDGIDSDYQTTLDRVMFITGVKSIDLYFGAAWDFVSSGPTNANAFSVYGGQPYPTCNSCGVNQWAAFIAHRMNPDLQKLSLARGEVVLNGGVYATFRAQSVDVVPGQTPQTADFTSAPPPPLEPRQAWALTPDLWVQLLWQKLRVEAEAATIQGQIGYLTGVNADASSPIGIQQYAVATQTEFRAIDDKLDLQFGFGWASGDPWTTTLTAPNGLRIERNQTGPIATFQFHPDYRVDLIFYRHILSRVEGSYYFRPSVSYDFIRHGDGERLGGGAAVIWSRASEFIQTPGHARDLGVELNAQLYYQSKDGSLNDDPSKLGGFYTMLQYGVFFPLAGLDYLPSEIMAGFDASLSAAQTVRLLLGIVF
jgi:uncharacterized protein (TIGR04551 family)